LPSMFAVTTPPRDFLTRVTISPAIDDARSDLCSPPHQPLTSKLVEIKLQALFEACSLPGFRHFGFVYQAKTAFTLLVSIVSMGV
jgi:hypothetical protein